MELPQSTRYDAVVIGAGLIGLSCAWRARKRGLSVLVVDRADEPGAGTSGVAAGMLAPVTEADFGEEGPLRVNLLARERWPAFAAELEEVTGLPTGYRDSGALVVAADRDDAEALRRLHEFQRSLGLDVRVADAVGVPGARAGPLAADRRRDRRAAGRQRRPARDRARARRRGRGGRARGRGACDRARRLGRHRRADERRASWSASGSWSRPARGARRWRRAATGRRCGR